MVTYYLATEGAAGKNGYTPIHEDTVIFDGKPREKALEAAVLEYAKKRKFKNTEFSFTDDHKIVAEAQAFGYAEPWINKDGYVVFVGTEEPSKDPDPDYAYWLTPKQAGEIRAKRNNKEGHVTYTYEDKDKIIDKCCELMQESGLVSEETIRVVFDINGRTLETLNDILFAVDGERDAMDKYEDELAECGLITKDDEEEDDDEDDDSEDEEETEDDDDEEVTVTPVESQEPDSAEDAGDGSGDGASREGAEGAAETPGTPA